MQFVIDGGNLKTLDLYGNYFSLMPQLPPTVQSIRLSVSGDEDSQQLLTTLMSQPFLSSINLIVSVREANIVSLGVGAGGLGSDKMFLGQEDLRIPNLLLVLS